MKATQTELIILALIMIVGLFGVATFDYTAIEAAKSTTGECASGLKNSSAQICHN